MEHVPRKVLREFGIGLAIILPLVFGLFLPWLFSRAMPVWPWWAAAILLSVGLVAPGLLAPIYRVWMRVALPVGRFNNWLLLTLLYFLILCPMGFVLKLLGRDPVPKKFDAKASTYRRPSDPPTSMTVLY